MRIYDTGISPGAMLMEIRKIEHGPFRERMEQTYIRRTARTLANEDWFDKDNIASIQLQYSLEKEDAQRIAELAEEIRKGKNGKNNA